MAFVLASPDGTVHHRYGGRDNVSPMNLETLIDIMNRGVETHREYLSAPRPPKAKSPLFIRKLVETQLASQMRPTNGCYHCHYVREAKQYLEVRNRTWTPDRFWIYPLPRRLGIEVDQHQQFRVTRVHPDTAAARAGVKVGDLLRTLAGKRVASKYDIQHILNQSTSDPITLSFSLDRDGELVRGQLQLLSGWKVGDPKEYAWRTNNIYTEHMRKYLPTPGLVGDLLNAKALREIGLPASDFALKVRHTNYGTHLSGIRRGDIILAAGGKSDFKSARDFYHWCELMRLDKRDINMDLLRHGAKMRLMVILGYESYTSVESSPEVMLGFIAQELPDNQGIRIGNVVDGSGADQAGLRLGDRIAAINGKHLMTFTALRSFLDTLVPGDTIAFDVMRGDHLLHLAYSLVDKDQRTSRIATMSEAPAKNGQELTCTVTLDLPAGQHVYSVNKLGFGVPTRMSFRGTGFELIGKIDEPKATAVREDGLETMWIHEGKALLRQRIKITDIAAFHLLLEVYAQVCDESSCHDLRAVVENRSGKKVFSEFSGRFDDLPEIRR